MAVPFHVYIGVFIDILESEIKVVFKTATHVGRNGIYRDAWKCLAADTIQIPVIGVNFRRIFRDIGQIPVSGETLSRRINIIDAFLESACNELPRLQVISEQGIPAYNESFPVTVYTAIAFPFNDLVYGIIRYVEFNRCITNLSVDDTRHFLVFLDKLDGIVSPMPNLCKKPDVRNLQDVIIV
jgi:hypothetical protein